MALIRFEQLDPISNMPALQDELDRFLRQTLRSTLVFRAKAPTPRSTFSTIAMAWW
jgi:hypothetical protein